MWVLLTEGTASSKQGPHFWISRAPLTSGQCSGCTFSRGAWMDAWIEDLPDRHCAVKNFTIKSIIVAFEVWFVHFVLMSILWGLHISDIGLNLSAEGGGYAGPLFRLVSWGCCSFILWCSSWDDLILWQGKFGGVDTWEAMLGVVGPKGSELKLCCLNFS